MALDYSFQIYFALFVIELPPQKPIIHRHPIADVFVSDNICKYKLVALQTFFH